MIAKRIDVTTSASSERASVSACRSTVADDGESATAGEGDGRRGAGTGQRSQVEGRQVGYRPGGGPAVVAARRLVGNQPGGEQPQRQGRRLRPPQPALGY